MNRIKNILKRFENYEEAEISVTYCAVDDLFTVTLTHGKIAVSLEHNNLDSAIGDVIEYVQSLKGDI